MECSIPAPEGSIDIVYSNQLMEHLHPEDSYQQLLNILKVLVPGGVYVCLTPNRVSGPHDVSAHFDDVATGFHLKEYTVTELSKLFREVGFEKVAQFIGVRGRYIKCPVLPAVIIERVLSVMPRNSAG